MFVARGFTKIKRSEILSSEQLRSLLLTRIIVRRIPKTDERSNRDSCLTRNSVDERTDRRHLFVGDSTDDRCSFAERDSSPVVLECY